MKVIEPGQDWKIAALRSAFHVHFLFGGNMKNEFLDLAFYYAEKAFQENEVPIGAVIVKNGEVISFGYNMKEKKCSVLDHAELIAIRKAEEKLQNWRLDDCDLYITLDPCPMCASAIKQARIKNVYSAVSNSDIQNDIFYCGNVRSWMNGNTQVFLPKADEDVVYVFAHILQHFYKTFHQGLLNA